MNSLEASLHAAEARSQVLDWGNSFEAGWLAYDLCYWRLTGIWVGPEDNRPAFTKGAL